MRLLAGYPDTSLYRSVPLHTRAQYFSVLQCFFSELPKTLRANEGGFQRRFYIVRNLFKIYSNNILSYAKTCLKLSFSLVFLLTFWDNSCPFSILDRWTANSSRFIHPDCIRSTVQTMKILIVKLLPLTILIFWVQIFASGSCSQIPIAWVPPLMQYSMFDNYIIQLEILLFCIF